MFLSVSVKKIFFLRNKEFLCFLYVLDPGDHFTKSRLASGIRRTKLKPGKISIPFLNRLTDPLQIWYDGKTT